MKIILLFWILLYQGISLAFCQSSNYSTTVLSSTTTVSFHNQTTSSANYPRNASAVFILPIPWTINYISSSTAEYKALASKIYSQLSNDLVSRNMYLINISLNCITAETNGMVNLAMSLYMSVPNTYRSYDIYVLLLNGMSNLFPSDLSLLSFSCPSVVSTCVGTVSSGSSNYAQSASFIFILPIPWTNNFYYSNTTDYKTLNTMIYSQMSYDLFSRNTYLMNISLNCLTPDMSGKVRLDLFVYMSVPNAYRHYDIYLLILNEMKRIFPSGLSLTSLSCPSFGSSCVGSGSNVVVINVMSKFCGSGSIPQYNEKDRNMQLICYFPYDWDPNYVKQYSSQYQQFTEGIIKVLQPTLCWKGYRLFYFDFKSLSQGSVVADLYMNVATQINGDLLPDFKSIFLEAFGTTVSYPAIKIYDIHPPGMRSLEVGFLALFLSSFTCGLGIVITAVVCRIRIRKRAEKDRRIMEIQLAEIQRIEAERSEEDESHIIP